MCKLCGGEIHRDSHGNVPYCSLRCRRLSDGTNVAESGLVSEILGSTAWRPEAIESVVKINSSEPIMIFSDIHAPLHSEAWIYQGLKCADRFGARTLIVNGDFIDANQISRHIGGYYRRKSELNDDFEAGEALLKIFAKRFDKVFFLNGNHCGERLVKVFRGEVALQRLWKMFGSHENVKVAARSFVEVNDSVIVGHPRQYSRIRGGVSQRIAQSWQRHVVLGHTHHSSRSLSSDAKWQACEVGCMAELPEFEYTTFEINDMPNPVNGFGMIRGESVTLFDQFTDWSLYGLEPVVDVKKLVSLLELDG